MAPPALEDVPRAPGRGLACAAQDAGRRAGADELADERVDDRAPGGEAAGGGAATGEPMALSCRGTQAMYAGCREGRSDMSVG